MTQTADAGVTAPSSAEANAGIDERYGRGRQRGIDKRVGWGLAGTAIVAAIVFFFASGWQNTSTIEFRDLSYSVNNDREVSVSYEVTAPAGSSVACGLEALSTSFATVGWKVVEHEPSDQRTRRFIDTLVTTHPGTTGIVRSCWVIEQSG